MNQGQMDHMQLEAMAAQAKESQAKKDAMVRDKSTGEAGVSPKLLFKAVLPDGRQCRIFADGSTEGFPENAIIHNYFKPLIDFERGLQKQSNPVAQKITTDDLHALISRTEYTRLAGTTKTFCHIFIGNDGFSVTGESACLNPADFDEVVGRDFAFKDAFNKLWPLEGYHRMRAAGQCVAAPEFHTSTKDSGC